MGRESESTLDPQNDHDRGHGVGLLASPAAGTAAATESVVSAATSAPSVDGGSPVGADVYRPERRRPRRARVDRGLPDAPDLLKLARAYVELQRHLWPHLAAANVLPAADDPTLDALVADFRHRHTTGSLAAAGGLDPRVLAQRRSTSTPVARGSALT